MKERPPECVMCRKPAAYSCDGGGAYCHSCALKAWKQNTALHFRDIPQVKVSSWADQSGGGHTLSQGTDANRPEYISSALGGKPVVRFGPTATDMTGDELRALLEAKKNAHRFQKGVKHQTCVDCGCEERGVVYDVPGELGAEIQKFVRNGIAYYRKPPPCDPNLKAPEETPRKRR